MNCLSRKPCFGSLVQVFISKDQVSLSVTMKNKQRFFIVASGQAEVISKGPHGEDLRIALLGDGEYFGEADLLDEQESTVSVRAITPTVFLGLKLKELIKFIKEVPDFRETFEKAVDKQLRLKASVNDNGEWF